MVAFNYCHILKHCDSELDVLILESSWRMIDEEVVHRDQSWVSWGSLYESQAGKS